jgi:hypothetical protein
MKPVPINGRRRDSQGGFALLVVFLMAAIIALMLYQQMPRVAFESEREKEQLLIDRGEQYTRAIQLYYLANNRTYPTSLDDLEKQQKRFLRRRFVDPFTGKADWRIIHTNGGFLTDSLVQKPPTTGADQSQSASNGTNNSSSSSSNNTANNTTAADAPPQVNAAVLQRPSDRPLTPPGFGQTVPIQDPSGQTQPVNTPLPPITLTPQQGQGALPPITLQPGTVNQPGGLPPITLAPFGGPQAPGQIPGQLRPPQPVPGQGQVAPLPGQPAPGGLPGGVQAGAPPGFRIDPSGQLVPNTNVPGQTLGQSIPGQPQGIPGQPLPPPPVNQPTNQPDATQGSPNSALNAINQLLTNPRQTNAATAAPTGGNQIGAIAGIASIHKSPSIKVYKDQVKYELWEFVFSPTANTTPGAAAPGAGIPPNGQGPGGPGQPGGPGAPSTFGPSGTFGPSNGPSTFGAGPGR